MCVSVCIIYISTPSEMRLLIFLYFSDSTYLKSLTEILTHKWEHKEKISCKVINGVSYLII